MRFSDAIRPGTRIAVALAAGSLWLSACAGISTANSSPVAPPTNTADSGAVVDDSTPLPTPTLQATATYTPSPTATPIIIRWQAIANGISQTQIPASIPGTDAVSIVQAYRVDPKRVGFQVFYDSESPHTIEDWLPITRAAIVVNGGFFASSHAPMGRVIIDGQMFGEPLDYGSDSIGIAGLFAVSDDTAAIYALGRDSFNPRGMRFDQAIECYPILLLPGGQPTFPVETDFIARRTVIAIDEDGMVVILVSNVDLFSLHRLAGWLSNSGLRLDSALNLDGGRSTGLGVAIPGHEALLNSYVPVPVVLGISPR